MPTSRTRPLSAPIRAVAVLVALAVAVTVSAAAAARPDAAKKQRVAFTTQAKGTVNVSPTRLIPLQAGAIKPDSGSLIAGLAPGRVVMRGGQKVEIYNDVTTFKSKRGSLVMRYRAEYVDAGSGYHVGAGTWKVIRGTGIYAGVTGGGRNGNVWLDSGPWSSRLEGVLVLP